MPPWRSRPRLMGTRRTVVSFISPVAASRTRCVSLDGISAQTLRASRIPMVIKLERMVRIASLPAEDLARRHGVALELIDERLPGREGLHVPQPAHPFHLHRLAVQLAGEVEEMDLEGPRRDPEGRPRPLVHHPPFPLPVSRFPTSTQTAYTPSGGRSLRGSGGARLIVGIPIVRPRPAPRSTTPGTLYGLPSQRSAPARSPCATAVRISDDEMGCP